ncbi:alpha/beta hydrolase fold-domain-containing protein [Fomitopsis serialis]|uniref:alpha/beta hydrolase fold-domain-containing protein n=1 Tax=Fomitopsis serialis TaxID=139415 RepID=UPI002007CE45|nr:alpha/beta hydrolase fold-domain-containing protein [Neoantrodia serialis]KAH9933761.1 alpha/beta hydrolase fold-domain-containing protein [Neoantrodia serialis]
MHAFRSAAIQAIYVAQRMLTTLVMVVWWAFYYIIMPRKHRPRQSWSLKQIICVNFTRRIYKVTELAGVTWGTRNPDEPCDNRTLKETRFEWIEPLPEEMRSGVVVDSQTQCKRTGVFVWPKDAPEATIDKPGLKESQIDLADVEAGDVPVIGIFMHGGGYCHMSAHENAPTSKIPRRLMKDKAFTKIYAVEYRLLQHAPFPAQVQDAAAVYYHIMQQYQRPGVKSTGDSERSSDTRVAQDEGVVRKDYLTAGYNPQDVKDKAENEHARRRVAQAAQNMHCKIVLIGDSAGGNLVLALARWIRDEARLPPPDGLLLLSPSCDPSDLLGEHPLEMMHSPKCCARSTGTRSRRASRTSASAHEHRRPRDAALDAECAEHARTEHAVRGRALARGPRPQPTSLERPIIASPRGLSLFSGFPRACVVLGDAERLEREVTKLVGAMERDGVGVRTVWVKDGAHDVLMMGWWDEDVRTKVYNDIEAWLKEI